MLDTQIKHVLMLNTSAKARIFWNTEAQMPPHEDLKASEKFWWGNTEGFPVGLWSKFEIHRLLESAYKISTRCKTSLYRSSHSPNSWGNKIFFRCPLVAISKITLTKSNLHW